MSVGTSPRLTERHSRPAGFMRSAALWCCDSRLAYPIRDLWQRNQSNSHMRLSALQKAALGSFLMLRDWASGVFPQVLDREATWENECRYSSSMTGLTHKQVVELGNIKPFHIGSDEFEIHSRNFSKIRRILRDLDVSPPARIVELGCGQGWLSEMLALTGFEVIGTSISALEIQEAERRASAFKCRNVPGALSFRACPMEEVDRRLSGLDCAIVYEALHHAFDWKETVHSVSRALRPGGWFLICAEPNIAHTLISYRVGKLTSTHEVGLSRKALTKELRLAGFESVRSFSFPVHCWRGWHWMAARRGA